MHILSSSSGQPVSTLVVVVCSFVFTACCAIRSSCLRDDRILIGGGIEERS